MVQVLTNSKVICYEDSDVTDVIGVACSSWKSYMYDMGRQFSRFQQFGCQALASRYCPARLSSAIGSNDISKLTARRVCTI